MKPPAPLLVQRRLKAAFGPQGWWPVTPAGGRSPRYRPGRGAALTERQRLEVCMGAILTQNTNWSNVEKALGRLQAGRIRDLEDYRAVPLRRLEALVRSSGYYRQKARKLKAFARRLARRGGRVGEWLSGDLPARRAELLGLFGVGPETADSMLLYAAGRPVFVIDAYTLRIGGRLGWFRAPSYERAQAYFMARLPRAAGLFNEFHAQLVVLAKRHCRKAPACAGCPLKEVCRHGFRP